MRSLIVLFAFVVAAAASCTCNSKVESEADPTTLGNAAQQLLSISITLLDGAPAIPHQLALVTGAMFEAYGIALNRKRLTTVEVDLLDLTPDQAAGYAGYAALSRSFAADTDKTSALDTAVSRIGLGNEAIRDAVGIPIATAVAMRYPLTIPPIEYTPPNPPSLSPDARCSVITDPDGWQPLCVSSTAGGMCATQMFPFLPLFNASIITAGGRRKVDRLIKDVQSPNTFTKPLQRFTKVKNAFTRDFNPVLRESGRLTDQKKITAEVFAPNAALGVHRLALDEAATRNLDLRRSVRLFFALSTAVRDAFIGSSNVKLTYSTIRPVTVLQCGLRGRRIRTWMGPYKGVGTFVSDKDTQFRSYLQSPPFPSYISGHTTVAGAAAKVLTNFFGSRRPKGANCFVVPSGGSVIEGKKVKGEEGFIAGVTDVPNSGIRRAGFTPASETTVCWDTFNEYARLSGLSRLFGGVHTPLENSEGIKLGKKVGARAFKFVLGRRK